MNALLEGTCTTAASSTAGTLTLEKLEKVFDTLKPLGEDPLAKFMREKGFDHTKGGRLVLPGSMRGLFGYIGPPWYVRLSESVTAPTLYRDLTHPTPD